VARQLRLTMMAAAVSAGLAACARYEAATTRPGDDTPSEGNLAPTIAGSPTLSAMVGVSYRFRPSAADPDGDALAFSIAHRPAWASFDAGTGSLSGTPGEADVGVHENVIVSVSDGAITSSLPPFAVTVTAAGATTFTIAASAGAGGSISPSGDLVLDAGSEQVFIIAPSSGYVIAGVTVDGSPAGAADSYTFSAIDADHTITAAFSAIPVDPGTTTASSLTMYSGDSAITWTFDGPQTIGRFVSGDPYVVDTGAGVVVTSVSPAQASGRNGSQINPSIGGGQPFDNRSRCSFNAGLRVSYPVTLRAGDSLVSTVSVSSIDSEREWSGRRTDDWSTVRSMAVLTVVDRALPPGTFRPPYYGSNKPLTWNVADVSMGWMPELATSGIRLPNFSSLGFSSVMDYFERGSERPWMVHLDNWCQREVAPHQNMFPYHQHNGFFISEASLLLLLDLEDREQLLYNLVQIGLDHYYLMGHGAEATSSFWKMPVLLAGSAFGDDAMLNAFKQGNYDVIPRDDEKFYDCGSNLSGRGTSSWTGSSVCFKKEPDEFYEEEHPSTWDSSYCTTNRDQRDCCTQEHYRAIEDSYPHIGMLLAARILTDHGVDLVDYWSNPSAFTYMDRWMTENFRAQYFPAVAAACGSASWADDYYDSGGHPQDSPHFVDDMYGEYGN
jgi:hypothetical protein